MQREKVFTFSLCFFLCHFISPATALRFFLFPHFLAFHISTVKNLPILCKTSVTLIFINRIQSTFLLYRKVAVLVGYICIAFYHLSVLKTYIVSKKNFLPAFLSFLPTETPVSLTYFYSAPKTYGVFRFCNKKSPESNAFGVHNYA